MNKLTERAICYARADKPNVTLIIKKLLFKKYALNSKIFIVSKMEKYEDKDDNIHKGKAQSYEHI